MLAPTARAAMPTVTMRATMPMAQRRADDCHLSPRSTDRPRRALGREPQDCARNTATRAVLDTQRQQRRHRPAQLQDRARRVHLSEASLHDACG